MVEMSSNCTKGIINYLSIFAKYFALLLNYMPIKTTKISKQKDKDNNEKGFTLAQRQVKYASGTNRNLSPCIQCEKCDLHRC